MYKQETDRVWRVRFALLWSSKQSSIKVTSGIPFYLLVRLIFIFPLIFSFLLFLLVSCTLNKVQDISFEELIFFFPFSFFRLPFSELCKPIFCDSVCFAQKTQQQLKENVAHFWNGTNPPEFWNGCRKTITRTGTYLFYCWWN